MVPAQALSNGPSLLKGKLRVQFNNGTLSLAGVKKVTP